MNKPLILIVEDDPPIRNLISVTLEAHEYRYITAGNAANAILEATSHNPDIMLEVGDKLKARQEKLQEAQLQESSHKADQQQNELHAQVDELQVLQDGRRAKRDILQQQLADLKAELSFAKASQDGLGRRLQQLESDLVTCGGRAENLQERLAKRLADQQTLEKRLRHTGSLSPP